MWLLCCRRCGSILPSCSSSGAEDLSTPVNLPLAVSFTDTDPTAGSYGGIVTGAARRVALDVDGFSVCFSMDFPLHGLGAGESVPNFSYPKARLEPKKESQLMTKTYR